MVSSISQLSEPIGTTTAWIRPDNTTPLPHGWLICDGSTVVDSDSPFNGKALPDLRAEFSRGHNTLDNSNFASDTLYYAGGTVPAGGQDTVNINHSHPTYSHRHTMSGTTGNVTTGAQLATIAGQPVTFSPHNHTWNNYSDYSAPSTNANGSSALENRPGFTEIVTIIKIK